jgi:phage-related tail fiber protein
MPWTVEEVEKFKKGLSASEKETWVEIANKALAACEKAGKADCDASAIKQANAVLSKVSEALSSDEATFVEAATFKALMQGLIRSAGAVAGHKSIPKALEGKLADLRAYLKKAYSEMSGEEEAPSDTVAATEASNSTSRGTEEEFKEEGALLEVEDG